MLTLLEVFVLWSTNYWSIQPLDYSTNYRWHKQGDTELPNLTANFDYGKNYRIQLEMKDKLCAPWKTNYVPSAIMNESVVVLTWSFQCQMWKLLIDSGNGCPWFIYRESMCVVNVVWSICRHWWCDYGTEGGTMATDDCLQVCRYERCHHTSCGMCRISDENHYWWLERRHLYKS